MQYQDRLWQLIHSLASGEKKYIWESVGAKSRNKYFLLLEELADMEAPDDVHLVKVLDYNSNPNALAVAKNYLFNQILRLLRGYRTAKSIDAEIAGYLEDIEILYEKELYFAAYKILQKANRLAEEGDRFELMIQLFEWERRLLFYLESGEVYLSAIQQSSERQMETAEKLYNFTIYYHLFRSINYENYKMTYNALLQPQGTQAVAIHHQSLQNIEQAQTPIARFYFYRCIESIYEANGQHEGSLKYNGLALEEALAYPPMMKYWQAPVLQVIAQHLFKLLELKEYPLFRKQFYLLDTIKIRGQEHFLLRRQRVFHLCLQLDYCSVTRRFEEAKSIWIPQIKSYFDQYGQGINNRYEIYLLLNTIWVYVAFRDYDEAIAWCMKAELLMDKNAFVEYYTMMRIMNMAIHLDLENFRLLESMYASLQRFLKKKEKMGVLEGFLMLFFKKYLSHDKNNEERKAVLKMVKDGIDQLPFSNRYQNLAVKDYVLLWIDARLQDRPMASFPIIDP